MAEEKKLSPAKQKIKANYEEQREYFISQGYEERTETISILKANVMAFVTAGPFAVLALLIGILSGRFYGEGVMDMKDMIVFWCLFLAFVFVHELLHGVGWVIWTKKKWKSIYIGMMWDSLTPYCHCKEPLKPKQYLIGGLTPFLVLGVGMFMLSLIVGNRMFFLLSIVNFICAGGDTTIACMLFRYLKEDSVYILDHPTEGGFIAYVKK